MFSTSIYSVAHQSPGSRSEAAETTQTTLLNNNNNSSRLSCRASRVGSSIVMVQISYLHVSAVVESSNMVQRQSNNNVSSVVNIETTVSQPPVISK